MSKDLYKRIILYLCIILLCGIFSFIFNNPYFGGGFFFSFLLFFIVVGGEYE